MRFWSSILFVLLFAACTREHAPEELRVQVAAAAFAPAARASDAGYATTFAAGDKIGITVVGSGIIEDNVPYQFDGAEWLPVGEAIHRYPGAVSYLVYYPYSAAMNGVTDAAEIFTPNADQSSQAAYTASDLMVGTGTFSGTLLTASLSHVLSLVDVELPQGVQNPKIDVGGAQYTPFNISGQHYRCVVKPAQTALGGTYTMLGAPMAWQTGEVTLEAGKYVHVSAINSFYSGDVDVLYTDGTIETVTYDPFTGDIPFTETSNTIASIAFDGKSCLIGHDTSTPLRLKIHGNGTLMLRSADAQGRIPIGSYAEFALVAEALDGDYLMECDLDFMGRAWTPLGSAGDTERNPFVGRFDGAGHSIANLQINRTGEYTGLFGCIENAEIKGVHVASGSVRGAGAVGAICGAMFSGSITACSNAAAVEGTDAVGGIVGGNDFGTVSACRNSGAVTGSQIVGGVAGENSLHIYACYNTGLVMGSSYAGGVVGVNNDGGEVTACYNTAVIAGEGVVSANFDSVTACYWEASGALVGINDSYDAENEVQGVSTDVNSFTLPVGFVPDAAAWPRWAIGLWGNYDGNAGLPQLYWE